ncbi:MAG TPA: hypothetical protein VKP30_28930 [Polyangiaceae bacterium]|nr:hypothetical protein [Polyangiaceae bacterium]
MTRTVGRFGCAQLAFNWFRAPSRAHAGYAALVCGLGTRIFLCLCNTCLSNEGLLRIVPRPKGRVFAHSRTEPGLGDADFRDNPNVHLTIPCMRQSTAFPRIGMPMQVLRSRPFNTADITSSLRRLVTLAPSVLRRPQRRYFKGKQLLHPQRFGGGYAVTSTVSDALGALAVTTSSLRRLVTLAPSAFSKAATT